MTNNTMTVSGTPESAVPNDNVIIASDPLKQVLSTAASTVTEETDSLASPVSDLTLTHSISGLSLESFTNSRCGVRLQQWCGKKLYSDFIRDGLRSLKKDDSEVIMLYESPSSSSTDTSFCNSQVFNYHDYPPFPAPYKTVLRPLCYSIMNGDCFPSYLRDAAPNGLLEHWRENVPNFVKPTFVSDISDTAMINAYLPVEQLKLENHVNDPHVHYHLAGKNALHLMSPKASRLLANTKDERPCVAKVTHAMGSKGIFVIRDDKDEEKFLEFLQESGNPTYVVTEFVDIARNVACHFFIHPSGEVTWFGSNENVLLDNGEWSTDSTLIAADQDYLLEIQLPFVKDVVEYCRNVGFWGFCGIDVLFDSNGNGRLVDLNPRVTASCPALMILQLLKEKYGYGCCLFRRGSQFAFQGSSNELLEQVKSINAQNEGHLKVILYSYYENRKDETLVNIAVYSRSVDECQAVLDRLAPLRL